MNKEYLPTATNFDDIEVQPQPDERRSVMCPKCAGHGYWNLLLNEYGPGKHFKAACGQCNGWGWVEPGPDSECVHEYETVSWAGHEHKMRCAKCGKAITIDTSG